ncbi:MAG: ABC transporter permease [Chitinophagaceae bacterium]|nr:ABC transporter permease [Anaerolineae bacterium]
MGRQVVSALITIWLAGTVAFFSLRVLPGDAISAQLIRGGASEADIDRRKAELGLDAPMLLQYERFLIDTLQGDFGNSLTSQQPVAGLILSQLWPTSILAASALCVAIILGLALGIMGTLDHFIGTMVRLSITLSVSMPIYWTGTLAIYLFSVLLKWLPSTGNGGADHLILPVGVLGFHSGGAIARITLINIRATQNEPFVQAARGKGLRERTIVFRHILRVGLIPVLTVIATQTGILLGGVVITESIFVRPGIGQLLLNAVIDRDYPVVQGIVILSAVVYTLLNLVVEWIYRLFDPRLAT